MKWKKTYVVGFVLYLQKEWDKTKIGNWKPKGIFGQSINLCIGILWLLFAIIMGMIAQLIETPIRMIIYPGKGKFKFWIDCWKAFNLFKY